MSFLTQKTYKKTYHMVTVHKCAQRSCGHASMVIYSPRSW